MTTAFYLPDTDVDRLRAFDPDRDWKLMVRGQRWVLQTFLRLREAGMDVELVEAWRELLEVVVPSLGPPGRRPPYWLLSATRRIGALVHARA